MAEYLILNASVSYFRFDIVTLIIANSNELLIRFYTAYSHSHIIRSTSTTVYSTFLTFGI